jgi:hypothetical protein
MMTVGPNVTSRALLRVLPCGAASILLLRGQERAVTFDIREAGELTWEDGALLLSAALAGYGLLRTFLWFIESRRLTIPWLTLRRVVPSGTLLLVWIILLISAAPSEALLGVFLVLNLPGVALGGALASLFTSAPRWQQAIVGSVGWWLGWYSAIRFAEWRAWAMCQST